MKFLPVFFSPKVDTLGMSLPPKLCIKNLGSNSCRIHQDLHER